MTRVAIVNIEGEIFEIVKQVFELTSVGKELIKDSGEIYIKPNYMAQRLWFLIFFKVLINYAR
jgi:hypothetical protein